MNLDNANDGTDNTDRMVASTSPLKLASDAAKGGIGAGFRTTFFMALVMVPSSLGIALLDWSGSLSWLADWLVPVTRLLGLPGEAVLVVLGSCLANIYSVIAMLGTLSLSLREMTILAVMTLTAHGLVIETRAMKRGGSSVVKMIVIRIGWAIALGWILNLLLPHEPAIMVTMTAGSARPAMLTMLAAWSLTTLGLLGKVLLLVCVLRVAQRLMEAFNITRLLARPLEPVMQVFGLPRDSGMLWVVSNVTSYTYALALMINQVKNGKMKTQDVDLFNHHVAICHNVLEDTALFMLLGLPLFWLVIPRLVAATMVVWSERIRRHLFRRSFRVGTA
jgi:hypothetical protein